MADSHSGPIGDEVNGALQWYMQELPEPGEDKEDVAARKEGASNDAAQLTGVDAMIDDPDIGADDVPAIDDTNPEDALGAEDATGDNDIDFGSTDDIDMPDDEGGDDLVDLSGFDLDDPDER